MSHKPEYQQLTLPTNHNKLHFHSCCAPCSNDVKGYLFEQIKDSGHRSAPHYEGISYWATIGIDDEA